MRNERKGRLDSWDGDLVPLGQSTFKAGNYVEERTKFRMRSPEEYEQMRTAWQGSKAAYISPLGSWGKVPHSELAVHTRIADKDIIQFSLFTSPYVRPEIKEPDIVWAKILTVDAMTEGLPVEVLSDGILNVLGGRHEPRLKKLIPLTLIG